MYFGSKRDKRGPKDPILSCRRCFSAAFPENQDPCNRKINVQSWVDLTVAICPPTGKLNQFMDRTISRSLSIHSSEVCGRKLRHWLIKTNLSRPAVAQWNISENWAINCAFLQENNTGSFHTVCPSDAWKWQSGLARAKKFYLSHMMNGSLLFFWLECEVMAKEQQYYFFPPCFAHIKALRFRLIVLLQTAKFSSLTVRAHRSLYDWGDWRIRTRWECHKLVYSRCEMTPECFDVWAKSKHDANTL